jgi:prophage regulatory protein
MQQKKLERLPDVLTRTGDSRSRWYAKVKQGTAPQPVKLGQRAAAWVASEIDAYIDAQIAHRDLTATTRHKTTKAGGQL